MKWMLPVILVFFLGCGSGSTTTESETETEDSTSFAGYTFADATEAITYTLMGVASDGTESAGADPAAMITPSGDVRLIFTGLDGDMMSATSSDGITFTVDEDFTSPFSLVGIAEQTIVESPTGGYRMFARSDTEVFSATSEDGESWTQESGTRFDASSLGLTRITGPSVVPTSDGQYRMYFSPEETNCGEQGVTSSIYSASSSDQLTWTTDEGERIGEDVDDRCKNKPSALVEEDGSITLFYHVYSRTGEGDTYGGAVFYANSTDGLTFTSQTDTGLGETSPTSGGLTLASDPCILEMPDGSVLLYFDVFYAPEGDQIFVSVGTRV